VIHAYDLEKAFTILLTWRVTLQLIFVRSPHTLFQNLQSWKPGSFKRGWWEL